MTIETDHEKLNRAFEQRDFKLCSRRTAESEQLLSSSSFGVMLQEHFGSKYLIEATNIHRFLRCFELAKHGENNSQLFKETKELANRFSPEDVAFIVNEILRRAVEEPAGRSFAWDRAREIVAPLVTQDIVIEQCTRISSNLKIQSHPEFAWISPIYLRFFGHTVSGAWEGPQAKELPLHVFTDDQLAAILFNVLTRAQSGSLEANEVPLMGSLVNHVAPTLISRGQRGKMYAEQLNRRALSDMTEKCDFQIRPEKPRNGWRLGSMSFETADTEENVSDFQLEDKNFHRKVNLIEKIKDDETARYFDYWHHRGIFSYDKGAHASDRYKIWRQNVRARIGRASINLSLLGACAAVLPDWNRERVVSIVQDLSRIKEAQIGGAAVRALGAIAQFLPPQRRLRVYLDTATSFPKFRPGQAWATTQAKLPLLLKNYYPSQARSARESDDICADMRVVLGDRDPKVRKAGFHALTRLLIANPDIRGRLVRDLFTPRTGDQRSRKSSSPIGPLPKSALSRTIKLLRDPAITEGTPDLRAEFLSHAWSLDWSILAPAERKELVLCPIGDIYGQYADTVTILKTAPSSSWFDPIVRLAIKTRGENAEILNCLTTLLAECDPVVTKVFTILYPDIAKPISSSKFIPAHEETITETIHETLVTVSALPGANALIQCAQMPELSQVKLSSLFGGIFGGVRKSENIYETLYSSIELQSGDLHFLFDLAHECIGESQSNDSFLFGVMGSVLSDAMEVATLQRHAGTLEKEIPAIRARCEGNKVELAERSLDLKPLSRAYLTAREILGLGAKRTPTS